MVERISSLEEVHALKRKHKAYIEFERPVHRYQAQSRHQRPELFVSA